MSKITRPILLVCSEMISSIDNQLVELEKFKLPTIQNFLYDFTLFEGLLRELNFQIFYAFPEKISGKDENGKEKIEISKPTLLATNDYYFILNSVIDEKMTKLKKDSMVDYIETFLKNFGIKITYDKDLVCDMTRARNIIAHSNAFKVKPWYIGSRIDSELLNDKNITLYIDFIRTFFQELKTKINENYGKYTYEKLLLDSWKFTCPSHFSIYEIFNFESGMANINMKGAEKYIKTSSSGEKYLLSIWLENYNPEIMYKIMSKCGDVSTSAHNTLMDKVRYLHELFRQFPYLVNQQKFCVKEGKING